jgi:hypothetical protein
MAIKGIFKSCLKEQVSLGPVVLNRYEPYTYFWDSRNPEPIRKFLKKEFSYE